MFFKRILILPTLLIAFLTPYSIQVQAQYHAIKPDSVIDFRQDYQHYFKNSILMPDSNFIYDHYSEDELVIDPAFLPVIFTGQILPETYEFTSPVQLYKEPAYIPEQEPVQLFEDKIYRQELDRQAYLYYTLHAPTSVKYSRSTMPKDIPVAKEIKVNPFKNIFHVENEVDFANSGKPSISLPKRRYYTASYETSIQFSQNYISENWYKGGNSNLNLIWINKFKHEYEKDKIKISNSIEYKLSTYTSSVDTLRPYRIGDDAFSIISSYGYRAFSKWYYSLSLDFRTQFFNNYYENKTTKSSAFLSPMGLNLGLGMEYKLNKELPPVRYRKVDLSINIAPFSYNMKYLLDDDVDKKRHGFKPDEDFIKNIGSKIIATMQLNFNRNISWNSKFYYFSNYEKVEMEFENTLNLALSRFFSTRIYFDVRFDDSVIKADPSDSYFQYYEILSFGFNYRF